jgi:predicted alpha/beta hydrolase family esterase
MMPEPAILIVPGLRDAVAQHWQTLLESELRAAGRPVAAVPPMGRADLDRSRRVAALELAVRAAVGPVVLVAHSGGCITVAHWAATAGRATGAVAGALLAAPPDFDGPMPAGYPSNEALAASGWMPVPRVPLPFPTLVAASRNDPLGPLDRVLGLARDWGSEVVDVGDVGHLNPASGFGPWPDVHRHIDRVRTLAAIRQER